MKEYIVEFEDVVKYRLKIKAENEKDAKRKVSIMCIEEFIDYEIDRNDHTSIKIINEI